MNVFFSYLNSAVVRKLQFGIANVRVDICNSRLLSDHILSFHNVHLLQIYYLLKPSSKKVQK